jgi:signal transduction histidine kinase/CheY-like chemotaxis protein
MGIPFRSVSTIFVPISLAIMVAFSGLGIGAIFLAQDSQKWVEHTHTVQRGIHQLLSSVVDAETGERGFLLTGKPEYLAPWRRAEVEAPRELDHLIELTADNPEQQLRLGRIQAFMGIKFGIIRAAIADKENGTTAEFVIDKNTMDSIRNEGKIFEGIELTLFKERNNGLHIKFEIIILMLLSSALISCAAISYAGQRLKRSAVQVFEAENLARRAQKMEAIGQLTGGIAHDFNNLLQVVLTNLDLAIRKIGPQQPVSEFLQAAMMGLDKGAKLTGHLLAFARQQPLRAEPIAIDHLLEDAVGLLRPTLGEKYCIEAIRSAGLWRAMVDAPLLQNAVLNVALNARDAMPDGGKLTFESANITLDAAYAAQESEVVPGQYVMIAISDTGTGMTAATLQRAFDPFFTTKKQGSGLGMAMVYGFIKQSGGHIKIYSEVGHGTTVKLYLPRTTKEEAVRELSSEQPVRGDGQTILVVEDDDGVRVGAVAQLSDLGYQIVSASDGETALELIRQDASISLLFTDIVLTGALNGRQLADAAKVIRPYLRLVYTSGYTQNAIVHHGRLDPGVTLLSKPYRANELARVIGGAFTPDSLSDEGGPGRAIPMVETNQPFLGLPEHLAILVTEDNAMVRRGLVLVLKEMGHTVMEAGTATEALAVIEGKARVDLLLTDLGLPDMSGIALATQVRKHLPDLQIIVATGQRALPAGAEHFPGPRLRLLAKPFSPTQLEVLIREVSHAA